MKFVAAAIAVALLASWASYSLAIWLTNRRTPTSGHNSDDGE